MAKILVLSDITRAFGERVEEWQVDMIRQRHVWWKQIGQLTGWGIEVVDTAAVLAEPKILQGANVCFIDMPLLRIAAYQQLWAHCCQQLSSASVLTTPEAVAEVGLLNRAYPVLTAAGLPCVRTAFVPLDDAILARLQSAEDLRTQVGDQMLRALASENLDLKRGLFIRTFVASLRKPQPMYFFAHTPQELFNTSWRIIQSLRTHNDVGGLALREYLPLETVDLPGGVTVNVEMRVWIVEQRLVLASYHGPYVQLSAAQQEALRRELQQRRSRLAESLTLGQQVLGRGLPESFVADVIFPRNREPLLLELNPIYSSGSNLPTARAWLLIHLAAMLAGRVGLTVPSQEDRQQLAVRLVGEPVRSEGAIFLPEA